MTEISRRRMAAAGAVAATTLFVPGTAGALDRALRESAGRAADISGTTLESAAAPAGGSGYRRLTAGPGWPLVVRPELGTPVAGRDDRRRGVASFVQFTDQHLVDAQSPMRFEYLHPFISSAHRPHETLTTQGSNALVARVNSLRGGPFTGRAFDSVVSTGDNTDNKEHAELDWFLTVMNGGQLRPNTGANPYEGVQDCDSTLYWQPDSADGDDYKDAGFPHLPGFLEAAVTGFDSPGLRTPWYAVFGNHDDSVQGTLPSGTVVLEALYTGGVKIIGVSTQAEAQRVARLVRTRPNDAANLIPGLSGPIMLVTADSRRAPFTRPQFVRAHLDPANTGPGPAGHGFTGEDRTYYTFPLAPGVTGISLDSTNPAGFTDGSIGTEQLDWLRARLAAGSSRHYDLAGNLVRTQRSDELFVLFSHHTSKTMDNVVRDPERLFEDRHTGEEILHLLHRFPNVVAWVNGHTHRNEIVPHPGPSADRSFWEVNTASHIDFPQHGRVIELADNGDGTLSLFTTLIEAQSPYAASYTDTSPTGLASLYRELAFNDPHRSPDLVGSPADHNTELVVANPLGARV
jgi:metallophosphoesterase (TIGR03767 family)